MMKQSDIFSIILIATIGTIAAFFLVNTILGDPNEQSVTFKSINLVESSLDAPDPEVFNKTAVNPTIEVYVGNCKDVDQNGIIDQAELLECGEGNATGAGTSTSSGGE